MSWRLNGKWHGTPAYLGGETRPPPKTAPRRKRPHPLSVRILTEAEIAAAYPGATISKRRGQP